MGSNPGYSPSELLRHRNRREKTLLIALITLNYRKTTLIYIAEKNDSIRYLEQQRLCETLLSEMTFETYTDDNRQFTDF